MFSRLRLLAVFAVCLGVALPAAAQVGHPLKGSWSGYWGPDSKDQHRILLLIHWDHDKLSGVINPGPKAVPIKHMSMDYDNWMLTVDADMPMSNGKTAQWVAKGKVENLGSWTNRTYSGTYQFGSEKGTFKVVLN